MPATRIAKKTAMSELTDRTMQTRLVGRTVHHAQAGPFLEKYLVEKQTGREGKFVVGRGRGTPVLAIQSKVFKSLVFVNLPYVFVEDLIEFRTRHRLHTL